MQAAENRREDSPGDSMWIGQSTCKTFGAKPRSALRPSSIQKASLQQGQASPACAPCAPVGCDSSPYVDLSKRDLEILKRLNDLIHQVGDCHEQPCQEMLLSIALACYMRKKSIHRQDQIPIFDHPNINFWFSWC